MTGDDSVVLDERGSDLQQHDEFGAELVGKRGILSPTISRSNSRMSLSEADGVDSGASSPAPLASNASNDARRRSRPLLGASSMSLGDELGLHVSVAPGISKGEVVSSDDAGLRFLNSCLDKVGTQCLRLAVRQLM